MGLIGRLLGLGDTASAVGAAAANVAEVFTPNATKKMALSAQAYSAALGEASAEFQSVGSGGFDRFVNGLNRLPRPLLALGTLGLFVYAMADPVGFSQRMGGLSTVPQPLWWLLGAVVSFYFGAREAHYFRMNRAVPQVMAVTTAQPGPNKPMRPADVAALEADNPALDAWTARAAR